MRRLLIALALMFCTLPSKLQSQEQPTTAAGHYLFAWTGDAAHKGNDFLAVIDADPASKSYGQLMTTLATDQQSVRVHHTEYVMPASGMLFANDHDAGRTFIFDVRDSLHPKTVASFTDMAGYMHPHPPPASQWARACDFPTCSLRRERRTDGRQRRPGRDR